MVRRIPDVTVPANPDQASLFALWRFHAFFTTSDLDTVTTDKTHRAHAIIEQVHTDLTNSALAHLPSGSVTTHSAWLIRAVTASNLTRAAPTLAGGRLTRASTGTTRHPRPDQGPLHTPDNQGRRPTHAPIRRPLPKINHERPPNPPVDRGQGPVLGVRGSADDLPAVGSAAGDALPYGCLPDGGMLDDVHGLQLLAASLHAGGDNGQLGDGPLPTTKAIADAMQTPALRDAVQGLLHETRSAMCPEDALGVPRAPTGGLRPERLQA